MPSRRARRIASVLLGLAVVGATARGQSSSPPPTPRPITNPGNTEWASTPEEARDRAARENKFVYIEFGKADCGDCVRMSNLVYPAFDFEALLIPMVPVRVDLDSSRGVELAKRYDVLKAPTVLVTTPEGRTVAIYQGFSNAEDFYTQTRLSLATYRVFAKKVEAQDVGQLSALDALETGAELWQRSDPAEALSRFKRALVAPKAPPALRDEARELLAAAQLDLGQTAASRQTINRLIATTQSKARREKAEIFRAQIPLAENKPAEANRLFQKFKKDHPKSPYIPQVNQFLERLSPSRQNP